MFSVSPEPLAQPLVRAHDCGHLHLLKPPVAWIRGVYCQSRSPLGLSFVSVRDLLKRVNELVKTFQHPQR